MHCKFYWQHVIVSSPVKPFQLIPRMPRGCQWKHCNNLQYPVCVCVCVFDRVVSYCDCISCLGLGCYGSANRETTTESKPALSRGPSRMFREQSTFQSVELPTNAHTRTHTHTHTWSTNPPRVSNCTRLCHLNDQAAKAAESLHSAIEGRFYRTNTHTHTHCFHISLIYNIQLRNTSANKYIYIYMINSITNLSLRYLNQHRWSAEH